MKLKYTLLGLALGLPMLLSARPASQHLMKMQNADGSTVQLRCFGDENFSWFTDADASVVMEQNKLGNWVEARRNGQVIRPIDTDLDILRKELIPLETKNKFETRMAPIDMTQGRTKFPTLAQDVHSLVVLIEYADTKFSVENPRQAIDDLCNKEGYSAFGSRGSARDYYIATSGGLFTPIFDVVGPIQVSQNSEYYVGRNTSYNGAGRMARFGEAIQEALKKLDEEGFDFSKYDYDENGDIDTVFFYYAGYGQADSNKTTTVWPHQADFSRFTNDYLNSINLPKLYLDGKRMGPYACSNELNGQMPLSMQPYLDGIGSFCHEFGHVLGLPDLYDTLGGHAPTPAYWSIMAQGSYNGNSTCPPLFNAYEKWVCHWLEFEDETAGALGVMPREGTTIEVPGLENNKAVRLGLSRKRPGYPVFKDEYFFIETRNNDGWDAELPNHGMLIWHLAFDYTRWTTNQVNTSTYTGINVVPASSEFVAYNDETAVTSVYPGAYNQLVSSKYNDVANSFWLTNIKYDEATGTSSFDYNKITSQSDVMVEIETILRTEDEKGVLVTWKPVEGATEYLVTFVSYIGTNEVNLGYNATSVGKNTSVELKNYANSFNSKECTVRVQASMGGIPSSKYAEQKFIPMNLDKSGVAELGSGSGDIRVVGSSIVAPAGARVFTLSGVETARENLPAGIYLVVNDGKTVKVAIR